MSSSEAKAQWILGRKSCVQLRNQDSDAKYKIIDEFSCNTGWSNKFCRNICKKIFFEIVNINIGSKSYFATMTRCLKITEKVSFNIASEASYVYIFEWTKVN